MQTISSVWSVFSGRYSQGEKMNLPWMLVRWKLTHNTSTMEKMYVWAFFFRRAAAGQRKASSDPGRERCKNFFSRGKVQVGCYFNAIQKPCNCCILSAKAFLNWALFIRQGAMHCSVIRLWPPRIGKVSNNSPLYAWYKPARQESNRWLVRVCHVIYRLTGAHPLHFFIHRFLSWGKLFRLYGLSSFVMPLFYSRSSFLRQ